MLNYKGVYYAKDVLDIMNSIKDRLIDEHIISLADLSPVNQSNLLVISKNKSIEFLDNRFANTIVKGFSEEILDGLKCMGKNNLSNIELSEVSKYYTDLKNVQENVETKSKPIDYFKLFCRYYDSVNSQLRKEIQKTLENKDEISKVKGFSFTFQLDEDNIVILPSSKDSKEDFYKSKNFFSKIIDYDYLGIRVPNDTPMAEEIKKYILVSFDDVIFSKDNVIVNFNFDDSVSLSDDKSLKEALKVKTYETVKLYNGKIVDEVSPLVSKGELMVVLKDYYQAQYTDRVIDNEPLYESLEILSTSRANKKLSIVRTGKNTISYIGLSEIRKQFNPSILNARTASELMASVNLMTPRDLALALGKSKKQRTGQ